MEHGANISVFIVEDSSDVRDALVDLLESLGEVTIVGSADNAATAIEAISRCRPDYVVLDYQLVDSTGIDVLRAIHPVMPHVVFIVLTSHTSVQYRRVCMQAGASWFLDKTRDFTKVKDIIEQLRTPS